MQDAVHPGQGSMLAILGMSVDEVEKEINLLPKGETCEIANDNSNSQVVVSGKKTAIEIQSPVKGTIKSLAQIDETYDVGTEIATIEVEP